MANISSAEGTITLKGNWTQQTIDTFKPVLIAGHFLARWSLLMIGLGIGLKQILMKSIL